MCIFEHPDYDQHEQILFVHDRVTSLRAIIAVHDTTFGPSLGGCRMWPYESEALAVKDVLRLSRGMTYKAAMAKVALGGGKSVIIGDSRAAKTPELLRAMGRAIDTLGGRYIVGEDIGTNPDDMREIRNTSRHVSCLSKKDGGYGDPAPMTALGTFSAIQAGVEASFGSDSMKGIHVTVQGVGNVGMRLCGMLADAGARLSVCDVHTPSAQLAKERFGATIVAGDAIFDVEADVFAPCAMGSVLSRESIPRLRVRVVAGAANNQLADAACGELLKDANIVYVPDYVANGGGLISCAAEWYRQDEGQITTQVLGIRTTSKEVIERARASNIATNVTSDQIARERIAAVREGKPANR